MSEQQRKTIKADAICLHKLQPIETAPRDGSKILLAGNTIFADGYWLQAAYGGAGAWIWPYVHKTPFYWMPLPDIKDAYTCDDSAESYW